MYRDVVTLFNRSRKTGRDEFWPTVLPGCDLNEDEAAVLAKYGASAQDKAMLHVRYAVEAGEAVLCGKVYRSPKEWRALTDEEKAETVTFQTGAGFDFFLRGVWSGEVPVNDEDYTDGFYNELNRTRDGVYAVSSAARYSVIPHFEVMGK